MLTQDFVLNGSPYGPVASMLGNLRWDPGMLRPYYDKHNRPSVTVNTGRWTIEKGVRVPIREHRTIQELANNGIMSPVFNATTLRKEEWIELDRVVVRTWPLPIHSAASMGWAN